MEQPYMDIRNIAVGALLTLLLFVFSITIPFLGIFTAVSMPLPIAFFRSKIGRRDTLIITLITMFIMILLIGRVRVELLLFSELIFLGFMLGEFFEKGLSIEKTIGFTSLLTLGTTLFFLFMYSQIFQADIFASINKIIDESVTIFISFYKETGRTDSELVLLTEKFKHVQSLIIRVLPALLACFVIFTTWLNLIMAKPIFKIKGITYPDMGDATQWKAPEKYIWILIGSAVLLFVPSEGIGIIGANILMVILLIYFFQGMAIIAFFFEKKNLPRIFRSILYGLVLLQQPFTFMVIILGVFDMWIDFRKLDAKKQAE